MGNENEKKKIGPAQSVLNTVVVDVPNYDARRKKIAVYFLAFSILLSLVLLLWILFTVVWR